MFLAETLLRLLQCFLTERLEDERSVLTAGAGESEPGESGGVHQDQAVLGEIVVRVERMPVGEVHLSLGQRVPAPGLGGVLVAPSQPPALLSPGDGN